MLKYYTSSTYRNHYSNLEKLHLLDESLLCLPFQISTYILKDNSSQLKNFRNYIPKQQGSEKNYYDQLLGDVQAYQYIPSQNTPIRIFKSLFLCHCYILLIRKQPQEKQMEKINLFFKWTLEQINLLIKKHSEKQVNKRQKSQSKQKRSSSTRQRIKKSIVDIFVSNPKKEAQQSTKSVLLFNSRNRSNSANNTGYQNKNHQNIRSSYSPTKPTLFNHSSIANSTNRQQQIFTKQVFLLSNILKPYLMYLQKIFSIYEPYENLLHQMIKDTQQNDAWTILNLFKTMTSVSSNFSYIGRYYYQQYSSIVYLLIELFSKEVSRLYPKLKKIVSQKIKNIEHQYFILTNSHTEYEIYHQTQLQIKQVPSTIMLIDQIIKTNDLLFHIYLGKYFYHNLIKLRIYQPQWFENYTKQCQFIYHYYKIRYNKKQTIIQSQKPKKSSSLIDIKQNKNLIIDHQKKKSIDKIENDIEKYFGFLDTTNTISSPQNSIKGIGSFKPTQTDKQKSIRLNRQLNNFKENNLKCKEKAHLKLQRTAKIYKQNPNLSFNEKDSDQLATNQIEDNTKQNSLKVKNQQKQTYGRSIHNLRSAKRHNYKLQNVN